MSTDSQALLPPALTASGDYVALNNEQRNNLVAKLRYCEEIAAGASDAAKAPDNQLLDAIDDIELDALSIMSGFSDGGTSVSPYRVHSSWTFESDRQAMAQYVGSDIAEFFRASPIGFEASNEEIRAWLQRWSQLLNVSLGRFSGASSFTEAIVNLILIDAFVCSYLVFAAIVRLRIGKPGCGFGAIQDCEE